MKTGVHPNYYVTQVSCACGSIFQTRSTVKEIRVEICSACHPFYTGRQRLVDTAGRVERFTKRFAKTGGQTVQRAPKTEVKKLESQAASPARKSKVLSTAPTTGAPGKKEKEKGKKKPAAKE